MKKNNPFPERTKQSAWAIILLIVSFARQLIRQFWFVILIILFNPARSTEFQFLLGLAALSVFSLLGSIIAYFRFYFHLSETDFHMEQGVLRKKSIQIPFERIQSIRIEQSLIHQALNVVKIEIDTAGSKNNELTITALHRSQADAIRAFIFSKKKDIKGSSSGLSDTEVSDESSLSGADEGEKLFELGFGTILKIGISQNHLRTLGIIFAFFLTVANRVTELFNPDIEGLVENSESVSFWAFTSTIIFVLPLVLLAAIIISVVQVSLRYADFTVFRNREGLRLISGLFTRVEQVAIRRKMQLMYLETNPIRRLLGLVKVRFFQASSNEMDINQSVIIPGCSPGQAAEVAREYLDTKVFDEAIFNQVDPKYRLRTFFLAGLLPLAGLIGLAYYRFGPEALWLAVAIPIIALIVHEYYKRLQYAISDDWILKREGIFSQKRTALKIYKIQSVEIYRGFYHLRHGLATVILHTAARQVTIPFITHEQAIDILDYLTAKVEMDNKAWM